MQPLALSPSHASVAAEMLAGTPCVQAYETFELCLAEHERSFAQCKAPMMAFRACMDKFADEKARLATRKRTAGEQQVKDW